MCKRILQKMMIRESEYGFSNWVRMITNRVVAEKLYSTLVNHVICQQFY